MDVSHLACGCFCCVVIVASAILIGISFASLHSTQFGLDYDHLFEEVGHEVYTGGLHMLGIANSFVKFPNTVQSIVYSRDQHDRLHARTNDGLPLILGVSFQYRLMEKTIRDLYMAFKDQHPKIIFNAGRHLISNGAANYSAYEFFNNKQGIAKAMEKDLNHHFMENYFCYLDAFQINTVHLPTKFEDAIQTSLNTKQEITRTQKMVNNVEVKLQTSIMVAHKNANSTIAKAEGQASSVLQAANAAATMTIQTVRAYAEGYLLVKNAMNLQTSQPDGKSELLSYIYNDALSSPNMNSAQFLVGSAPGTYINANTNAPASPAPPAQL